MVKGPLLIQRSPATSGAGAPMRRAWATAGPFARPTVRNAARTSAWRHRIFMSSFILCSSFPGERRPAMRQCGGRAPGVRHNRVKSFTAVAGRRALRPAERAGNDLRKARLDLRRDRLGDFVRAPRPLQHIATGPQVEVRVLVLKAELHRDGIDELLEPVAQGPG